MNKELAAKIGEALVACEFYEAAGQFARWLQAQEMAKPYPVEMKFVIADGPDEFIERLKILPLVKYTAKDLLAKFDEGFEIINMQTRKPYTREALVADLRKAGLL